MSYTACSSGQHTSSPTTPTDLDSQLSVERDSNASPTLIIKEAGSQQRTESTSSLSSSSSSSSCSKDEKVEMSCAVTDCEKSAYKSRRYQLLPWKCKYHRNKTYKETYKRRRAVANQDLYSIEVNTPSLDPQGDRHRTVPRQRLGGQGSMLEQVLNEKKMALMQSPVVLDFLQKQQQKKHQQQKQQQQAHQQQTQQQKQWGLQQQSHSYGHMSHR